MKKIVLLVSLILLNCGFVSAQINTNDIMITHYSPRYNAASDEYIVLFNNTSSSLDINGYEIAYAASSGSVSIRKQFISSTVIPPRQYYLLSSNASVTVGNVSNQLTDATYTSFAADAGQIAFRKTSDQTVIFALATGSITTFAFGLTTTHTTTTSASSQGAFQLTSSGNTYIRSGDNNSDYTLVAASSISDVPNSGSTALPVQITVFMLTVNKNKVTLTWSTATEVNNYGFEIQRSLVNGQRSVWEKVGFVQGNGNSNSPKNYSFKDEPKGGREFRYRLKQIDFNGAFEYSEIVTTILEKANEFKLEQNFPNPFNPITRISYTVPERTNVKLCVYDLLAQKIAELVNGYHEAGRYEVTFDGSTFPSGTYFYKLEAGSYVEVKKLLLIK